ncbi:MAG: hypothetical protein EKK42_02135 [Pseudonocardiaceae bacterium]|nr:MAG: hypothetical protein EKK42_02135 [Pseudonocardiaceae bacterium]
MGVGPGVPGRVARDGASRTGVAVRRWRGDPRPLHRHRRRAAGRPGVGAPGRSRLGRPRRGGPGDRGRRGAGRVRADEPRRSHGSGHEARRASPAATGPQAELGGEAGGALVTSCMPLPRVSLRVEPFGPALGCL